jgi:hypothetical protein
MGNQLQQIAILYQDRLPPLQDGIQKPMKPGGYSDSGADIACELLNNGLSLITPVDNPKIENDFDWAFPDSRQGIQNALNKGAKIFWLNTVLYKSHPIESFFKFDIELIGQLPSDVEIYDNKWSTNSLLKTKGLPLPKTVLINKNNQENYAVDFAFPVVVKPIRGRGSQGVSLAHNKRELDSKIIELLANKHYGTSIYIEQYLSGQEITITVMPAGTYTINNKVKTFKEPWCLPAVKRFNHEDGIAPYCGTVAVISNSSVLEKNELNSDKITAVYRQCQQAATLLNIRAPIRIDCRADNNGKYFLFDLNMKPNMTGPSRPQRQNQDSLSLIAARAIGWSYFDFLNNIIQQRWKNIT